MPHYDYATPGVYFVTLCTHGRRFFFNRDQVRRTTEACWLAIPQHNLNVTLDEWVVMPNHLHGLIEIHEIEAIDADHRRGVQLNAPSSLSSATPGTASIFDGTSTNASVGDLDNINAEHRRGVQLNAVATDGDVLHRLASANDEEAADVVVDSGVSANAGLTSTSRFSAISPRAGTLSVIVRTYKAAVTTACRAQGLSVFQWQRGFYEHVVRKARELDALRRYVRLNPQRWDLDRDNPANERRLPPSATIDDYLADLRLD